MTTTYAVLPDQCPGSNRIPQHYRAACYHGDMSNPEGQCRSCGEWLPVDWNGADPETGWRTVTQHERSVLRANGDHR
jgi:hypothetical protein